jgi:hypothetical protein
MVDFEPPFMAGQSREGKWGVWPGSSVRDSRERSEGRFPRVPPRCQCGHQKAIHWEYGRMQGCSQCPDSRGRCRCRYYHPISTALEDVLVELFRCVAACERDWVLMDRIDLALGTPRRRGA